MKEPAAAHKATRETELSRQLGSAGEQGVALTPPPYGIEFADRELPESQRSSGDQAMLRMLRRAVSSRAALPVHTTKASHEADTVRDVVRMPGQPLDAATRAFMEPRFGHDFRQVRVHAGADAAASAAAMRARAYTIGQHIVFGAGQPSPESLPARLLLAHELAHVVQQTRGGPGRPAPEVSLSAPHERDARAAAMAVVTGRTEVPVACSTGVGLARQHLSEEERAVVTETLNILKERLEQVKREAVRLLGGRGLPPVGMITRDLERLAARGGSAAVAANAALIQIRALQEQLRDLNAQLGLQGPRQQFSARTEQAAAKVEGKGAGAAATATTGTTAGAKVESTVASAAATEVKTATRLSRFGSGLARVGSLGLSLLLPGPLDAVMLMVQFAGSYTEAREAIRSRNTRTGFALGLAGALLNRSHRAVRKHFRRSFVEKDAVTEAAGAVGVAEIAHNTGLDAGFKYGELLSDDARYALTEIGYSALRAQGRLPESQERLAVEGLGRLSTALLPTVDQIFEAMQAQAEREQEAEQRKMKRESGCVGRIC